ncbi:uncharacterized protein [Diadema setosum]|uniref:uncharacterized protein n=1 Tax=Diadema setosum TaxID=31175 RepID=UPI003B3BA1C0
MASMNALLFALIALFCLMTSVSCDEGSGDEGSAATETMFDVTEVVTELVTDEDDDNSPSDIQAFGLVISNDFEEFVLDIDNIVTYSVTIKNAGGTNIASSSDELYDLSLVLSDSSNPNSNSATTSTITPLLTSATNLNSAIAAGSSIVIENVHTMINIASENCTTYEGGYTCIVISKADGASYEDSSSTNNYYCLSFGAVADGNGGTLTCSACAAKVSFIVLLLSALMVFFTST